mgnify:CR=1 FL=1
MIVFTELKLKSSFWSSTQVMYSFVKNEWKIDD